MMAKFACLAKLRKLGSTCGFQVWNLWAALINSCEHFETRQKLSLKSVAQKWDGFSILLTGFGKSLIFQLLPCQWRHENITLDTEF